MSLSETTIESSTSSTWTTMTDERGPLSLDTDDSALPTCAWSDLDVQGRIGSGSFAMVVKASSNNETVAVKRLLNGDLDSNTHRHALKDLKQEAQIMTKLNHHPNIVSIKAQQHQNGSSDDSFFFAMECLQEDTLETRIGQWAKANKMSTRHKIRKGFTSLFGKNKKQQCQVPTLLERLENIGLGLARALDYIHQHEIVHCDIKPANIGFTRGGDKVKLFDFGLSRDLSQSNTTTSTTKVARSMKDDLDDTPVVVGSLRYMAPEVLLAHPVTYESDIYSFGLLLWSLISLEKPHKDLRDIKGVMNRVVLEDQRPDLDCILAAQPNNSMGLALLRQLITDCWKSEPTARPTSKELLEALEQIVALLRHEQAEIQGRKRRGSSFITKKEKRSSPTKALPPRELSPDATQKTTSIADSIEALENTEA